MPHESKFVTKNLDVLALSEEVERDSQSGKLNRELLVQGQTLYGKNSLFPEYFERITPDGKKSLGYWRNYEFKQVIKTDWQILSSSVIKNVR
ncbi:hypothetical protein JAO78_016435 [Alishewanella sp. 16-MA]|uniref:Uncharacterized protein n=1 Tax=Alishewanella maricola TaxID=2795740 RepID=A0ABS8C7T8_9ALTE|nr:hypothetical protein [Alishewanella maricola]MCB5228394.1 hypothetical protein [Alishewanella maricola]